MNTLVHNKAEYGLCGETPKGVRVYGPIDSHHFLGKIMDSEHSGKFRVIYYGVCCRKKQYFQVCFLETGNTQWCRGDRMQSGKVKDSENWEFTAGNVVDEVGNRYGKVVVLERNGSKRYEGKGTFALWKCLCDCGQEFTTRGIGLRQGTTRSCGCVGKENTKWINYRHGDYKTPEYNTWLAIKNRCFSKDNKAYPDYGGRGIAVCDRWADPENGYFNFLEDMGRKPKGRYSIGREDNNGDYCPENCKWETDEEQANNKRRNKNNSSGRTGVYFDDKQGKWCARLGKGSKLDGSYRNIYLGQFKDFDAAVEAREIAELKYFGKIKE